MEISNFPFCSNLFGDGTMKSNFSDEEPSILIRFNLNNHHILFFNVNGLTINLNLYDEFMASNLEKDKDFNMTFISEIQTILSNQFHFKECTQLKLQNRTDAEYNDQLQKIGMLYCYFLEHMDQFDKFIDFFCKFKVQELLSNQFPLLCFFAVLIPESYIFSNRSCEKFYNMNVQLEKFKSKFYVSNRDPVFDNIFDKPPAKILVKDRTSLQLSCIHKIFQNTSLIYLFSFLLCSPLTGQFFFDLVNSWLNIWGTNILTVIFQDKTVWNIIYLHLNQSK